jgi:hypothetical protein
MFGRPQVILAILGLAVSLPRAVTPLWSQIAAPPLQKLEVLITDENGVAVPAAHLKLQGAHNVQKEETDFAGRAKFTNLPEGKYQLRAEKEGYYALSLPNIEVGLTFNVEAKITHVQEVKEVVNVVESPPTIDPEQTADTRTLSNLDVINIPYPVTRDYRNVLQFIPGVVQDQNGQPHIAGGQTYQTLQMLDSFDITDPINGQLSQRVSTDAIRSIDVQSSRYSAQFGRSSAGVLNITTGMGDDRFRYSGTNFVPSFKFINGLNLDKWTPRFTVSGPLQKGKLWFYEAWDGEFDQNIIRDLPKNADSAPIWRISNLGKLQVNLTPSNILTGSLLINQFKYDHAGLSLFNPLNATTDQVQNGYLSTLKDQHYFHSGALLETGFAFNALQFTENPLGDQPYVLSPGLTSGNFYRLSRNRAHRAQGVANLYLPPRKWHGRHEVKLGLDADRIAYHQFYSRRPITVLAGNGAVTRLTIFSGQPAIFQQNNVQLAGYSQDRWSITDHFLLEGGLRFDWDQIVRQVLPSPRLAATYVLGAGQTKFSAGIGRFYDATNVDLITRPLQGSRVDQFFAFDGVTPIGAPVVTRFIRGPSGLDAPRFWNWSLGVEQKLPHDVYLRTEYLDRRGTNEIVYVPVGSPLGGTFNLTNARQDHYRALTVSVTYTLLKSYPFLFAYTRSSAHTNAVLDYSIDNITLGAQAPGPLPWDTPNRFLTWGMFPLPSLPIIHKLDFAYSLDLHDGFPFSVINAQQQVVPPIESQRFPRFFSFNPYIEKRFRAWGRIWALRGGFDNFTNRKNPSSVDNNIDSANFLTFGNFDKRTFVARIRLIGKK